MEKEISELEDLQEKKEQIVEAIRQKKQEIVDKYSNVKVGDIVISNGYSHKGKEMIVNNIYFSIDHWKKTIFLAKGSILKKDGSASAFLGEHYFK